MQNLWLQLQGTTGEKERGPESWVYEGPDSRFERKEEFKVLEHPPIEDKGTDGKNKNKTKKLRPPCPRERIVRISHACDLETWMLAPLDARVLRFFLTHDFLPQCWETRLGQEMYKLLLFDLLTGLAVMLLIQFPRK